MRLFFLNKRKKDHFIKLLKDEYKLNDDEYTIYENDEQIEAEIITQKVVDAHYKLNFENDDIILKISLFPPINGKNIDFNQLIEMITAEGVKELQMDKLTEAYQLFQENYIVTDLIIAQGVRPIPGKDAKIILHFQKKDEDLEKKDDGGKIDYKLVKKIINVRKGEVLITKYPATKGVPGLTVKGAEIPAKEGKDIEITVLEGVEVLENGKKYVAALDGYVHFEKNRIAVYPIYVVKDVNYETGSIDFLGTVHVKGDILSGFEVKASKDIVVDGVCEDARLYAKENIYFNSGVKGKLNREIYAEKSIFVNYAENAKLTARENIVVKNYLLNCEATAGDSIIALEGKGQLAGGRLIAFNVIECLELGAKGSEKSVVICGKNFFAEQEIIKIKRQIKQFDNDLQKIEHTLSKFDLKDKTILENDKIRKLVVLRKKILEKIKSLKKVLESLKENRCNKRAKIKANKIIRAGVDIQICDAKEKVTEDIKEGLFFLEPKYNQVGWINLEGLTEEND